jgi:hypothetical protein
MIRRARPELEDRRDDLRQLLRDQGPELLHVVGEAGHDLPHPGPPEEGQVQLHQVAVDLVPEVPGHGLLDPGHQVVPQEVEDVLEEEDDEEEEDDPLHRLGGGRRESTKRPSVASSPHSSQPLEPPARGSAAAAAAPAPAPASPERPSVAPGSAPPPAMRPRPSGSAKRVSRKGMRSAMEKASSPAKRKVAATATPKTGGTAGGTGESGGNASPGWAPVSGAGGEERHRDDHLLRRDPAVEEGVAVAGLVFPELRRVDHEVVLEGDHVAHAQPPRGEPEVPGVVRV